MMPPAPVDATSVHGSAMPTTTTEYPASQHMQSSLEEATLPSVAASSAARSSAVSPALLRARQSAKPLTKSPPSDALSRPFLHDGPTPPQPDSRTEPGPEENGVPIPGAGVSQLANEALDRHIMPTCSQCSDFTCVGGFFHGCCYWCHMSPSAIWSVHVTPTLRLRVRVVSALGSASEEHGLGV